MNRRRLFLTIVIVLLIGVAGCKKGDSKSVTTDKAAKEDNTTSFAVTTTMAVDGELKDYLELNGNVTARSTVDTYADTAGKLKHIYVKVGDVVKKDQVIAQVDPSKPGMTFASSPVKASISGTVTEIPPQIGSLIAPNLPIARISKMNELQIDIYVAERFISKIKIGLPAIIKSEAYPGEIFTGSIRELSPVVDKISRTMEVKLSLDDPQKELKAGMFAAVKLITEEKKGIVKIPSEALIKRFGKSYVFVIANDLTDPEKQVAKKRIVAPGLRIDNQLEITSGLEGGEVIVIRGQTLLEDGSNVKVVSTMAPLESLDKVE